MARSSDINQRISLTGAEEVRRQLEEIGKAGGKSADQLQQGFLKASQGTNTFGAGTEQVRKSSGQLRFALQNLTFQANDVFTSIASGQPAMRVFAQQGGQIVQAFQQGGGLSNILGAVKTKLLDLITPMRTAAAAGALAAGAFALLSLRAEDSEDSVRKFGVVLKGLGKLGGVTDILRGGSGSKLLTPSLTTTPAALATAPRDLEEAAKRLRSAGLTLADARTKLLEGIRAGIDPAQLEKIVRIGQDLNAVLGAGADTQFIAAIKGGVGPLREFAAQLGVIGKNSSVAQDGLGNIPTLIDAIGTRVKDADKNALGPFGQRAREINIRFQELEDSAARFFREGTVNAVDTSKAFGDMVSSLGQAIGRADFSGLRRGLDAALAAVDTSQLRQQLVTDFTAIGQAAYDALKNAISKGGQLGAELGKVIADALVDLPNIIANGFASLKSATDGLAKALVDIWPSFSAAARDAIAYVRDLLESLKNAVSTVFSRGSNVVASAAIPPALPDVPDFSKALGSFASGGLVRGRGTGTSDSMWARVSNGEYWVNAVSTRRFLPVLEAINSMRQPIMPRSRSSGFAAGGLVATGAGGRPVNIVIGGRSFGLSGAGDVVGQLERAARERQMLSAGRRPSTQS